MDAESAGTVAARVSALASRLEAHLRDMPAEDRAARLMTAAVAGARAALATTDAPGRAHALDEWEATLGEMLAAVPAAAGGNGTRQEAVEALRAKLQRLRARVADSTHLVNAAAALDAAQDEAALWSAGQQARAACAAAADDLAQARADEWAALARARARLAGALAENATRLPLVEILAARRLLDRLDRERDCPPDLPLAVTAGQVEAALQRLLSASSPKAAAKPTGGDREVDRPLERLERSLRGYREHVSARRARRIDSLLHDCARATAADVTRCRSAGERMLAEIHREIRVRAARELALARRALALARARGRPATRFGALVDRAEDAFNSVRTAPLAELLLDLRAARSEVGGVAVLAPGRIAMVVGGAGLLIVAVVAGLAIALRAQEPAAAPASAAGTTAESAPALPSPAEPAPSPGPPAEIIADAQVRVAEPVQAVIVPPAEAPAAQPAPVTLERAPARDIAEWIAALAAGSGDQRGDRSRRRYGELLQRAWTATRAGDFAGARTHFAELYDLESDLSGAPELRWLARVLYGIDLFKEAGATGKARLRDGATETWGEVPPEFLRRHAATWAVAEPSVAPHIERAAGDRR